MEKKVNVSSDRLVSLDVMRGLIMILLAGESCAVWESLKEMHLGKAGDTVVNQFFHHRWHGLHLWDMVQPAFMLMAGTAMYLSYQSKLKKGVSWSQNFKHIAVRALKLFLLGTGLHCIYAGKLVFELWNVLTQLSFTTLIAYLIINRSFWFQIGFTLFLLILTEVLYRAILMPGFDQPFVEFHNFGAYMDNVLMGKINPDGWVAINIIPTAAHTIWGVLVGKMLTSPFTSKQKISYLIIAGAVCLIAGFGLDIANITPIIKRISTSSFVLASAGWVLLFMAALYWFIDVQQLNKHAWIFTAVGMNAIFLYLFFETVGAQWFNGAIGIFVKGGLSLLNVSTTVVALVSAMVTLFAEWCICYWLSRNRIFIKI
ncbi:acyltransferase family protein [Mucilaginibacter ximonensis]|uniref:Acyltransferase family protein n=1 Tax=Mucilaginibacter ximonensis TaxID=538021 RepID=A0ABW5YFW2_9SPHI